MLDLLAGVLSLHWDAASQLSLSQEALHEGNTEQSVNNNLASNNKTTTKFNYKSKRLKVYNCKRTIEQ